MFREVREKQPWDRERAELPALLHSHRAAQGVSNQEKAGLCLPGETVKGSTMLLNLNRGTKTQQEESSCLMTLSLCNKLRFSSLSKCAEIGITMGECVFLILSPCATAVILKAGGFDLTRVTQGFSPQAGKQAAPTALLPGRVQRHSAVGWGCSLKGNVEAVPAFGRPAG